MRFKAKSVCSGEVAIPSIETDETIMNDHKWSLVCAITRYVSHNLVGFEVELSDGLRAYRVNAVFKPVSHAAHRS